MANSGRYQKLFDVQQANAMLPLVRAIAADMSELSQSIVERQQRLSHVLSSGREMDSRDPYDAELLLVNEELERDIERLQGYLDELRALGVEPKGGVEGLVDFPSLRDGRVVFLCWKLGEPEVMYWHEIEAGFAGRQPLSSQAPAEEGGRSEPCDSTQESPSPTGIPRLQRPAAESPLRRAGRPVEFGMGQSGSTES